MQGRIDARGRIAQLRQIALVDRQPIDIHERCFFLEASLDELLHEAQSAATGQEAGHPVHIAFDIRDIGAVIIGGERGILLLNDGSAQSAEGLREAADGVEPACVVGGDGGDLSPAELPDEFRRRRRWGAAILGDAHQIGIGQRSGHGEFIGAAIGGDDHGDLLIAGVFVHR